MKVEILVTPKKSVFDPQGDAVLRCLHTQGLEKAVSVRIGKFIELEVDESEGQVSGEKLDAICRDILSNPVIEDYSIRIVDAKPVAAKPAAPVAAVPKPKVKKEAPAVAVPAPVVKTVAVKAPAAKKAVEKAPVKTVPVKAPAPAPAAAKAAAAKPKAAAIGKVLPLKEATAKLNAKKKA